MNRTIKQNDAPKVKGLCGVVRRAALMLLAVMLTSTAWASITLKSGSGTGADVEYATSGDYFQVPDCPNTFTAPSGQHFNGWALNGSGENDLLPGTWCKVAGTYSLTANWSESTALKGKIYVSIDMKDPIGPYNLDEVFTLNFSGKVDVVFDYSITIHAASSYEMNHHYTPTNSIDLNSNSPVVSQEFAFYDKNHGGWFNITEDGSYDFIVSYDGNHFLVTAYHNNPVVISDDFSLPSCAKGIIRNVKLGRTFPAGKKQTVCLPFAPDALLTKGTVWEFTGIENGKAVMTQRTSELTANTPYIFEATNDLTSISFENVEVNVGADPKTVDGTAGFTFHGTYEQKHWLATSDEVTQGKIYGFMAQDNDGQTTGQFVRARRETYLRPFCCYLEYNGDLTGTQAAARRVTRGEGDALPDVIDIVWVSALGSTTGIHAVDAVTSQRDDAWYSLDGRRLSGKPSVKGVYINNGRKVVIK